MSPRLTPAHLLTDLAPFSRHLIDLPLYPYQLRPLHAILDSIRGRHGREFLLIFPRQSGKNEAIAQLLVYLLNLLQRRGGSVVYGATGEGLGRGIRRQIYWDIRRIFIRLKLSRKFIFFANDR